MRGPSQRPAAVFFGTPDFSIPSLDALHAHFDVRAVITQPDRPAGRGLALKPPPVKERALQLGLEVAQPTRVRTEEFAAWLRAFSADVALVVAYGRILPPSVLGSFRLGCVNVHASLLPRWRGAAPIQWAIAHGDEVTGVCLMQMDEGMDTGPMLVCSRTPIGPDETSGELAVRLSKLGGELVDTLLVRYLAGELPPHAQDESAATYAPLLKKEHGAIDLSASARAVHDLVRGMNPFPGAFVSIGGTRVKVHRTRVLDATTQRAAPGTLLRVRGGIDVACGVGVIAFEELQLEGRRRLRAHDFAAGVDWVEGARFEVRA